MDLAGFFFARTAADTNVFDAQPGDGKIQPGLECASHSGPTEQDRLGSENRYACLPLRLSTKLGTVSWIGVGADDREREE